MAQLTNASMSERAVFIGSIFVWDTIGTLPPRAIEIVALFPPAVRRVMGRKAPRKRLACRNTARPTGASHAPERLSALRPPLDSGLVKRSCKPRAQKTRRGNEEVLFDANA